MKTIRNEVDKMKETQMKMEKYMRRNHLIFRGVAESSDTESCENTVYTVLKDHLQVEGWDQINLDGTYRLGRLGNGRVPRPILVCFAVKCDRDMVRSKAYKLAGKRMSISEDLPRVLQERRNSLAPILKDKRKAHSGCSI